MGNIQCVCGDNKTLCISTGGWCNPERKPSKAKTVINRGIQYGRNVTSSWREKEEKSGLDGIMDGLNERLDWADGDVRAVVRESYGTMRRGIEEEGLFVPLN